MTSTTIQFGNRAVRIFSNSGLSFSARLYVNVSTTDDGDATLVAGKFKTLAGAEKWAARQVAS